MKKITKSKPEFMETTFKVQADTFENTWRTLLDGTFETLEECNIIDVGSNDEQCTKWCTFEFDGNQCMVLVELKEVALDRSVKKLKITVYVTDQRMLDPIRIRSFYVFEEEK